jgi:acetaldehyde dehydrogenase (acetylating)
MKVNVGIIGTGNIGTDLLVKIQRSKILKCSIFTGIHIHSKGIEKARSMGIPVSDTSIEIINKNPNICDIVFDATSAESHAIHAPILKSMKKFVIDMTPSRIGRMCVPLVNLGESLNELNVNMITCGGQAIIPIAVALKKIHPEMKYFEIVSSISSKSAGIGTRNNIDEYTLTTCEGIRTLAKIPHAKAIVIINPAEPPILMHNTIFASIGHPQRRAIEREVRHTVSDIQKYVPGYRLIVGPIFENDKVTIMTEVTGRGDYLPKYAGNLDIINCAGIMVAEEYAKKVLLHRKKL